MNEAKHAVKSYSDGHPLDEVHYREFKILLKPDHFTQAHHFKEFGKLLRHAAAELDVALSTDKVLATLALVNDVAVEEIRHDLGELHFGHGVQGKANVAVWRRRAAEKPLIGEFAFQCTFKRADELHNKASRHADRFFLGLQHAVRDWAQLGTTKTRVVYGMGSTEVHNRE